MKKNLDVKLIQVPPLKEVHCESIRNLNSHNLGKTTIIFGTVIRTGNMSARELIKDFQCKLCGRRITCESDISEYNKFILPTRCDAPIIKTQDPFENLVESMNSKMGKN